MEIPPVVPAEPLGRAVAFAIDMVLIWAVWKLAPSLGAALLNGAHDIGTAVMGSLWTLCWPLLYFTLLTHHGHRTPGLLIVHVRVQRQDGSSLSTWTALARATLFFLGTATMVPFLANGILLLTGRRHGFHDRLTQTEVVHVS